MEAETVQDSQTLLAEHADVREKLDGLQLELRGVDGELDAVSTERRQHHLLKDACGALEQLDELGGGALFWEGCTPARGTAEHIRGALGRIAQFEERLAGIEERRDAICASIREHEHRTYVLEDDIFDAQEEEERRRLEWIVEREIGSAASRSLNMPWTKGGEDDRRFRKTLGTALLVSLLFALILPMI